MELSWGTIVSIVIPQALGLLAVAWGFGGKLAAMQTTIQFMAKRLDSIDHHQGNRLDSLDKQQAHTHAEVHALSKEIEFLQRQQDRT